MAEIDRLTLEIDSKAQTASSGIDSLISNLQKLSSITDTSAKNLKTIASSINSLKNSLNKLSQLDFDKVDQSITRLNTSLSSIKTSVKAFADTSTQIKTMTSALNSLNRAMDKLSKNQGVSNLDLSKMTFNVNQYQRTATAMNNVSSGMLGGANMLANIYMLSRIGNAFGTMIQKANDYIETMNLFSVVMGENTRQASEFVYSLEAIGVDMEQAMRYQASFYDIGKSLGLTAKNANTLSEQFTKLTYDYASLYNLPVEESFQKLQAAIVGTTEPIRRLGKDISIAKLEEVALNLGIEESVRNMTQAEKAELRFIAVMQQSTAAMNDMERTIDQPANALRVLKAQFTSLVRDLGNLFIPIVSAVLPYLIALAKFLREVVSGIAAFFGIDMFKLDFNTVNSSLGVADKYTSDLSDNLADGADSAKKIKDYMLGIDELNVLNKDTGTISTDTGAAGVGSGSGLGLDLEDFGYETLLKNVQSKADEILKTFEAWKTPLLVAAGILATIWTVGKIYQFITALKNISTATSALGWGIRGFQALGGLITGLGTQVGSLLGVMGPLTSGTAFAIGLGTVAVAFAGVAAAVLLVKSSIDNMDEAAKQAIETRNFVNNLKESMELAKQQSEENMASYQQEAATLEVYGARLKNIVDENGNLLVSQSEANVAIDAFNDAMGETVYSIDETTGKIVDQNGAYVNLKKSVDDLVNAKKAQFWLEAHEDEYKEALENQQEITEQLIDATTTLQEVKSRKYSGGTFEQLKDELDLMTQQKATAEDLQKFYKENREFYSDYLTYMDLSSSRDELISLSNELKDTTSSYEDMVTAIQTNDIDMQNAILKGFNSDILDGTTDSIEELTEKVNDLKTAREAVLASDLPQEQVDKMLDSIDQELEDYESLLNASYDSQKKLASQKGTEIGSSFGQNQLSTISSAFNTITSVVSNAYDSQKKLASQKGTEIGSSFGQNQLSTISSAFNTITSVVSNAYDSQKKLASQKGTEIGQTQGQKQSSSFDKSFLSSVTETMSEAKKLIENKWSGINLKDIVGTIGVKWDDSIKKVGNIFESAFGFISVATSKSASVTAFASGGFVPSSANFVSPDMWTAGEAGKELVGSYQGRTTVMPLENTSFVSAMYQAIYQATRDAYGENETTVIVQPKVEIGGKEIKQAEQEYQYSSGGGLIKKK